MSLTIERLVAVKWPAFYSKVTRKPVAMVLGLTWFLGLVIASLGFVGLKDDVYFYLLFSIDFAIPTLLIGSCHLAMLRAARKSSTLATRHVKKDMKIARMILVIIGLFLLCWLPFFTLNIIYYNCSNWCEKIPKSLINIFKLLHYSNSMMNFFVYAVRSPDFRRSFTSLIQCKMPRFTGGTITIKPLSQRTLPNLSNSYHRSKGNLAKKVTFITPLRHRAHSQPVNLTEVAV